MFRSPILVVLVALAAALGVLALVGRGVLERDRQAMYDGYAHQRLVGIDEAAHGLAADVADLGDDLDLAATLLQKAESARVAERELHAIATIKREYLVMDARADDGTTTRVGALDAPPGVAERADGVLARMLDEADADPGRLHRSSALSTADEPASWYRVFALRPRAHGPSVAAVIDMTIVVDRLKLQRDPGTKLLVLSADGRAAPNSDPQLAAQARLHPAWLASLLDASRGDQPSITMLDPATASSLGIAPTVAVAIAVPVRIESGRAWTLVVVSSTVALAKQERVLVHRVLVGGALVLVLLLSAAGYVIRNTRRAATLRERLRHADHLAHLTEKAEKIIDHIPSGVLTLAADLRITGVNRWFLSRLPRDIGGLTLGQAFEHAPADDLATLSELVALAARTHEAQSLPRIRLNLFGAEALLSIDVIPLARAVEDVSLLVVLDDLTQLRRIEERLLHSEKLVTAGQLAAGIAHEIGTPLNVARGRVELVLSHLGAQHAEASNHTIVLDQIDRVTRLIQHLLDYVRPTPTAMQAVDPVRTMEVIKDLLSARASKSGVALEIALGEPLPNLDADPDQLQQVLVNLVLNAIDACDRGGRVELRAAARGAGLQLEIIDDGSGIPHDIQPQIFDPFFTTKKRGQGTGLGLWVVAQLVRAHAAEIEVESSPGVGTTVRLTWPVVT